MGYFSTLSTFKSADTLYTCQAMEYCRAILHIGIYDFRLYMSRFYPAVAHGKNPPRLYWMQRKHTF
jgi:hypothetical protein